jgi:MFS transporter, AAHS family, 4-hydroxybenzoate transporter
MSRSFSAFLLNREPSLQELINEDLQEKRMSEIQANAPTIDVGKLIDDSKLNRVSVSVILLCGLIMLMDGFDYQIISVAAPLIKKEWNISNGPFGWVFSAAFLGYFFGAILFGTLSDKIGRKKTLILAACCFSVGTLLVYFTNSLASLIAVRVFTGIGIGGAVPCAITLTSEYSPLKGRGKYVSIMYSGFLVGIVFGGFLAGYMLGRFGWRPLFLIGFIAPVFAITLLALKLPESARWLSARNQTDKQRTTLIEYIKGIEPNVEIAGNTRFLSPASNRQKRSLRGLFYGKLAWVTPVVWSYYLISSIAVFFIGSWSPILLGVKGYNPSTASYITGYINVFITIGCLLSGFLFDKIGFRWGSILYIIAAVCVLFTGGLESTAFVVLLLASGFFINSGHMDVTILAPIVYPPNCRNQGAGMAIAVGRLGAILGPIIGGYLLDTKLPMGTLIGVVSIPLVIAAILCYIAGRQYDFYFAPLYAGKINTDSK